MDYSTILVKDLPYYRGSATYVSVLNNNGIETLDDLLDKEKMEPIIARARRTKKDLKCLYALARHQYLGEPLPNERLMEKEILGTTMVGNEIALILPGDCADTFKYVSFDQLADMMAMGASITGAYALGNVIRRNGIMNSKGVKVVDLMKMALADGDFDETAKGHKLYRIPAEIYRISIAAYEAKHGKKINVTITPGAIRVLQKRLTQIHAEIAKLNAEEVEIQQKILTLKVNQISEQYSNEGD